MDLELFIAYTIATSMLLFILIYSVIHLINDAINTIDEHDDYDEKSN